VHPLLAGLASLAGAAGVTGLVSPPSASLAQPVRAAVAVRSVRAASVAHSTPTRCTPPRLDVSAALAGSLLIAALTASFLHGIEQNPAVPPAVSAQASTELAGGIPFLSDADLQAALTKAGASKQVTQAVLDENEQARLDGLRTALAALALLALIGLFFSTRIPAEQPGSGDTRSPEPAPGRRRSSDG